MTSNSKNLIDNLVFNKNGLIPAIAQDWLDGSVLMMAWMNKDSLIETLKNGEAYYWSRSRSELWHKGSTSGHIQKIKSIRVDCDSDAILLTVQQIGSTACHTGKRSCFFKDELKSSFIDEDLYSHGALADMCSEVFKIIKSRKNSPASGSYTNKLLEGGVNGILKKIGEESAEFVMACKDKNSESIANEAADLIFHLQVALVNQEVPWEDVLEVLANRRNAPRRN